MDPCQYIQERAQKITEALYRVTDLFSDKEPIKWLLRKKGINIFNCLSFLDDNSPDRRLKNIEIVSGLISSILRVLEVASAGAFISAVNFEVLRREYRALGDFINNNKKDILPSPTVFLSDSIPKKIISLSSSEAEPRSERSFATRDNLKKSPDKGHSNGQERQKGQIGIKNFNGDSLIIKDTIKDIKKIDNNIDSIKLSEAEFNKIKIKNSADIEKPTNIFYNNNDETEVKFNRQKKILEFVKNNGWVGAREVSAIFNKNISEKTVQRDLIAMADFGVLRKAGDKRWRRYASV